VQDLGHAPSGASNGADALDLFNAGGADVVLSDWVMPRLNGVQLCRSVRASPGAPYTYFVLLTALGDTAHRLAALRAGADGFLAKPFSLADIEACLIAAERVTSDHRRREALLRQARGFAAETNPARLLDNLLDEAIRLVGGSAGLVTRWDDEQQALVAVGATASELDAQRLRLGEGASGRAAQQRAPVLVQRSDDGEPDAILVDAQLESAVAVPLLDADRLVGTLAVGTSEPAKTFTREDGDLLAALASSAAVALMAHERARLEGVLLAARTAQHELNNQLAVARGYAEMLVGSPDLPPHLAEMAEVVMSAADDAASVVRQLRTISHIAEHHWPEPSGSTINLTRSQD